MSTLKIISKNTSVLILGYVISYVLRILYIGILARYVGIEGIGQISTATAICSVLIILVNFGFDTLLVRDLASGQKDNGKYITNVAFIRLALTILMVIILTGVLSLQKYQSQTQIIIVIYALTSVLDAFSNIPRSVFNAAQKMEFSAGFDLTRDILNFALSIMAIKLGWSIISIVWMSAFASLIKLIISQIIMQRLFIRPIYRIDLNLCIKIFTSVLPFAMLFLISIASSQISTIILSWYQTSASVGIYSAAAVPIGMLLIVPNMFMESVFPAFSRYYQSSSTGLVKLYKVTFKVLLLLGFPMGMGIILVSKYVIPLIYGTGFESAVPVMNIVAFQLLTMVGYINGAFLNATDRQTLFVVVRLGMIIFSIILSFILIPRYSYIGAALSTTIPSVIDFWLYSILCHRFNKIPFPWGSLYKAVICTALMGLASYAALSIGINIFIVVLLLAPLMYLLSLIVFRVFGLAEWKSIYEISPFFRWRNTADLKK